MADEKRVAGLKIIIDGIKAEISTNFDDCESTVLLFVALLTMLKQDIHALKHFTDALAMVNSGKAETITMEKPKKETVIN